jgi:hypothetical protein
VDAALIGDNLGFFAALLPIPMLLAVFPTGRIPSRRWRWFPRALIIGFALLAIGSILKAGPIDVNPGVQPQNPTGIPSMTGAANAILAIGGIGTLVLSLLSVVIVIVRFRASRGEERQQLRWLASVAALSLVAVVAAFVTSMGLGPNETTFVNEAAWFVLLAAVDWGVPGAIGIALLRYRLWDLDVVVRKTVVGAIVVVLITALALAALAFVGAAVVGPVADSPEITLFAGITVGLAFWPLRRLARRISDRVVYGGRATPYDVLTEFSDRMSETYSTDDVLPRMAAIVAAGTRAERVGIWLLVGGEMQPAASWPQESADEDSPAIALGEGSFEVGHQGELLGAITVSMPGRGSDEPVEGEAHPRSCVASGVGAAQRPAHRGAPRVEAPNRDDAGRAGEDARAEHPRRSPATARRPGREAPAGRGARAQGPGAHRIDAVGPTGRGERRAREPAGSRPRDLSAAPRRPGPSLGPRGAGAEVTGPGRRTSA